MPVITLQVPDELEGLLAKYESELPQILEQGIRTRESGTPPFDPAKYDGTAEIFEFLVSLPALEEILKLKASDRLQQRISDLLEKNRNEGLTGAENQEMDHYETVENLVRVAKVRAAGKLGLGLAQMSVQSPLGSVG